MDVSDQADKERPLRPKEEERKSEYECGIKTSLFLRSEVTLPSLPAHICLDAILERRQEAGGNLNIPKLFQSLSGFALIAEIKVNSFHFSRMGTCEE